MFSRMPTEPMPTGDEQRHFAAATQHLANPAARLTVEEVEIMDEERCGVPVNHGSSAAGIAAMDRRLAVLATAPPAAELVKLAKRAPRQHEAVSYTHLTLPTILRV